MYQTLEKIGHGLQSKVYRIQNTNKALKVMNLNKRSKYHFEKLKDSEIFTIEGIVQYHTITMKDFCIYITMDLYYTDLFDLIKRRNKFLNEQEARILMSKICKTLKIMHEKGFIHRDVKPENILLNSDDIDENSHIVLCDLESIATTDGYYSEMSYGTIEYIAPEASYQSNHKKLDTYSLGKTLWKITGEGHLDISNDLRNLYKQMTMQNTEDRLSIFQVMEHNWLNEFSEKIF